jgi:hypothetical protein
VPERERARESESVTDERGRATTREGRVQRGSAHWRARVGREGVTRERARARGESMGQNWPSRGERVFPFYFSLTPFSPFQKYIYTHLFIQDIF